MNRLLDRGYSCGTSRNAEQSCVFHDDLHDYQSARKAMRKREASNVN
jgi:hypothetical protein